MQHKTKGEQVETFLLLLLLLLRIHLHFDQFLQWLRGEIRRFYNEFYHKPADKPQEWWDMRGMEADLMLLWHIARLVAHETNS